MPRPLHSTANPSPGQPHPPDNNPPSPTANRQELAIRQLTDAVCHHLATPRPGKPLIVSAHGPPGVGKTLTHQLLARALYNARPSDALQCPGKDCKGYKARRDWGLGGWGFLDG